MEKEGKGTPVKEEMILIFDAGRGVSYDIKLSAAKEYIATAKALEARLIEEGKI
jgi:hypothetical protein